MKKKYRYNTKLIHGGQFLEKSYHAIMPPIYQTSTYAQTSPGKHKGYEYSRTHNPTRAALERAMASIENGKYGFAFSSGMAAIDAVLKMFCPGDEIIVTNDLYGGSYRLFEKIFKKLGLIFHFVAMENVEKVVEKITPNTRLIWAETPTNPMIKIVDIQALSKIAKQNKILLAVDNTFASPFLQQPLILGADIVMHSATKYLSGHSDVVLGAIVVDDSILAEKMAFIQNASGAICGPMDSFLVLRGIKTLHVRMQRHCENGRKIAFFLKEHPGVEKVFWAGFPDHLGHNIAKRQMKDFGGMLSFIPKNGTYNKVVRILEKLKIFTLAESLGGVESLVGHPASMTHASIPKEEREKSGVGDHLIRLSVGIEDGQDLIEDLEQALG